MEYPFNFYNNVNEYRRRAQTLQPTRHHGLDEADPKLFIMAKYFNSVESDRANYANVDDSLCMNLTPVSNGYHHHHHHEQHNHHTHNHGHTFNHHQHQHQQSPNSQQHLQRTPPLLFNHAHGHRSHQHQHQPSNLHQNHRSNNLHHRSQSQHYYQPNTLCQVNDFNNYYNISNFGGTIIPARSRHPSPINGIVDHQSPIVPPPPSMQQLTHNMNNIDMMQVFNELGCLDAAPPLPEPRNYTISRTRNSLYKVALPQRRLIKGQYTDILTGISLTPGTAVSVLHPSKEDRSKFTICLNDQHHVDISHHLTHVPQPTAPHWNY